MARCCKLGGPGVQILCPTGLQDCWSRTSGLEWINQRLSTIFHVTVFKNILYGVVSQNENILFEYYSRTCQLNQGIITATITATITTAAAATSSLLCISIQEVLNWSLGIGGVWSKNEPIWSQRNKQQQEIIIIIIIIIIREIHMRIYY